MANLASISSSGTSGAASASDRRVFSESSDSGMMRSVREWKSVSYSRRAWNRAIELDVRLDDHQYVLPRSF